MINSTRPVDRCEELACAKVNLALRVHGKRTDGYHEIESWITFVDVGDRLTVAKGASLGGWRPIATSGPYAIDIDGDNLIDEARRRVAAAVPSLADEMANVVCQLEKNLPVAAGLGGGSADCAAILRAIARLYPVETEGVDWWAMAAAMGADVPACLSQRPTIVRGTGTKLEEAPTLPRLPIVLVNANAPTVSRKTPRVFQALGAPPCPVPPPQRFVRTTRDDQSTFAWLTDEANDLEAPASIVMPQVAEVMAALKSSMQKMQKENSRVGATLRVPTSRSMPIPPSSNDRLEGDRLENATDGYSSTRHETHDGAAARTPRVRSFARLSGAGPTCFALFDDNGDDAAAALAVDLAKKHPSWWIRLGRTF